MTVQTALKIDQLEFGWQPGKTILSIPTLTLNRGESLFIRGPSGSGKSTLLNLMSGVLRLPSGNIQLLEQPFSSWNDKHRDQFRSDHIGYIFQQFNLLPYLSVLDNVLLPCRISAHRRARAQQQHNTVEESARTWLSLLNIPSRLFEQKISNLSVGQQQRVAAARALIGEPEIIIADEPTSALDQDNVDNFMDVLTSQCRNIRSSLIFVSHDRHLSQFLEHIHELPGDSQEEVI
ncbi:ABC transporter ATP-binding protein [Gynuella sp.]|uniref:ABC transporter ATP-binding protein n=1 Tax=Gynuella sp. TaxID=2969146 RepID=UPI003D141EB9